MTKNTVVVSISQQSWVVVGSPDALVVVYCGDSGRIFVGTGCCCGELWGLGDRLMDLR